MPTMSTRGAASEQGFNKIGGPYAPPPIPTVIGTAYGGGYYAGRFRLNGLLYGLVVSPAAQGVLTLAWSTVTPITEANTSKIDGYANSNLNVSADRPVCEAVKALNIGGYSDWYIPAINEAELMYRNLKPTTVNNIVGGGVNPDSVPTGAAYTTTVPSQTPLLLFRSGGAEAITSAFLSSTRYLTNAGLNEYRQLGNGDIGAADVNTVRIYRAVRKFLIVE